MEARFLNIELEMARKVDAAGAAASAKDAVKKMLDPSSLSTLAVALDKKADKDAVLSSKACGCVDKNVLNPDCGSLPLELNAVSCSDTTHTGSTCQVQCKPGFTGAPATFKCNLLGQWEGSIKCEDPNAAPPANAYYKVTKAGTNIVNGYYAPSGSNDGRRQYVKVTNTGDPFKTKEGWSVHLGFSGGYGWHGYTWTLAARVSTSTGIKYDGIYYCPEKTMFPPNTDCWKTCQGHANGCGGDSQPYGNGEMPRPIITKL